jgi:hypothetical protein
MINRILIVLTLLILFSCKEDSKTSILEAKISEDFQEIFTVLAPEKTGIFFLNELKESTSMNGLLYEYYYNGGGVAVADFNNDGLIDIYYVNSIKSNALYLNQGKMRFREVTSQANADGGYGFGTGVTVVDINNDGLMDLYYSKSGKISDPNKRRNVLLVNKGIDENGIPKFENQAEKYGLDSPDFTTQASFFDYDKDGDLDMFIINHGIGAYDENDLKNLLSRKSKHRGNRLYQNTNGRYVDVSDTANIINNMIGYGLGVSIGDLNNDGWPDIYVGNDFSEKDFLYINNKNGTFKESSQVALKHMSNFSMGNDIADINNDGYLDIMAVDMMAEDNFSQKTSMSGMEPKKFYANEKLGLHSQYMYNTLQLNRGVNNETNTPMFSEIGQLSGISSSDWSWAPLFLDMNNDGHKDLFISNGIKGDFRNNDFVNYRKAKQEEVIKNKSIQANTYISDMLSKMPSRQKENYFYVNNGDLTFKKAAIKQNPTNSNGAAYADFDNDGDLDIVVNNSDGLSYIYKNNATGNNFIKLKLIGTKENRDALGARVLVYSKSSTQTIENYFTRGFQSAMADALHFGINQDQIIDSIKVVWNDNTTQLLKDIKPNQTLTISHDDTVDGVLPNKRNQEYLFTDITAQAGVDFEHQENDFNDFEKETLLPHRMSQLGPALAVADVNGDGLEDFYIGGAKGYSGVLYLQTADGKFSKNKSAFISDKNQEDVGAVFFDADNDGDQDLYVISGGTEESPNSTYYLDRFYENTGSSIFLKNDKALPKITASGLRVAPADFDNDGDLDLFIGGRVVPGFYGRPTKSYLLENISSDGKISFKDVTEAVVPEMLTHHLITAVTWADLNNDSSPDLVIANEWGSIEVFINESGTFKNMTDTYGLSKHIGWWSSLAVDDIDGDGDLDIIAGNLGLNYKYKASFDTPFYMYVNDFDENNTDDIVLGYSQDNEIYPVRGRGCTSGQMPFVKDKFTNYSDFGASNIEDIYGDKLKESVSYEATYFASAILKNEGNTFKFEAFENAAQVSSVNKILIDDFNEDATKDILLLGNLYGSEVETPRNDASYGSLLLGFGTNKYKLLANNQANLWASGDVKDAAFITIGNAKAILIARNNGKLSLIKINKIKQKN